MIWAGIWDYASSLEIIAGPPTGMVLISRAKAAREEVIGVQLLS